MEVPVRLALTGSPGTGKTTVSSLIAGSGYFIQTMESLAEDFKCIETVDPEDGARPIDIEKLRNILETEWSLGPSRSTVIDGHLSHLLPVDCVVILRCRPVELRERLAGRSYSEKKISDNIDWEILGGAWAEVGNIIPVIEFETTSEKVEDIVRKILEWVADDFKPSRPVNPIDWVGRGEA